MASAEQMFLGIQCESMQKLINSTAKQVVLPVTFDLAPLDTFVAALPAGHPPLDTIDIEGHSGSGKTQFLYYLLSTCIIPSKFTLDMRNNAAVVIDMDGQFDLLRFRDILKTRLRQHFDPPASPINSLVERILENLCIFRPITTEQLLVTLSNIPKFLKAQFPTSRFSTLLVHSLEASYWFDRLKVEQTARLASTLSAKGLQFAKTYSMLKNIQEAYNVRIIISHSGLNLPFRDVTDSSGLTLTVRRSSVGFSVFARVGQSRSVVFDIRVKETELEVVERP